MKWMKVVAPFLILLIGYAGMKAIGASASEEVIKEEVDTRPTVTIEDLNPVDYTVLISSYGEVTPLESTNLAAQVAGEVVSWHPSFVAGGLVKRGDVLFSIEKDTYEAALLQAEANLSTAQAQLIQEQAQAEVASREATSLPSNRVTDLYLRKPQVLSAKAAVKYAEAQIRIATRDLENCEVKAPYDALVVARNIGVGDFVAVGTVAATMNNIETAEIVFPIARFDRNFLPADIVGKEALVNADTPRGNEFEAYIHRDTGIVDQTTRMTHLVARVDDPYGLHSTKPVLKFGAYATVSFKGRTLDNVYRVPQELITNGQLWTLDEENKLVSQPVDMIREDGGYFLIRGEFDSNRVVMNLPEYPQTGMSVKVIAGNDNLVAQRPRPE
ncbi:efflux RND transporter periplasmic adaptor subunit [Alteromonas pelagimontana]|uniref:Efflux RND transporter periplasmic adaptor subunit n=1 Tax=Alteromonas pelagimontana TaxID=1858656 RepID=A0A6M4M9I5_9ALTE|nr:efflux RND transporter periplasmic adaptor subunit [Alteromonas pelagimontana]QJR79812.1 efflux RND transporter periplasmic adaptor subunit [Alteromonas pelagimontana]